MRGRPMASSPWLTSASMVGQMKHVPPMNSPVASTRPMAESNHQPPASARIISAEAEFERVEIAAPLSEPSALQRSNDINQADQRGKSEIVPAVESKPVPHEKINVVGKKRHREGRHAFNGETCGLKLAAFRTGHIRLEISRMAARQYHFTASDIGGCSLSNSAAEHQRMS